MTRPTNADYLLYLLQRANDEQPVLDRPHLVDDQELMFRWSCNQLSEDETERILEHLSLCPECREILTTLVECEVWELPALSLDNPEAEGIATQPAATPFPVDAAVETTNSSPHVRDTAGSSLVQPRGRSQKSGSGSFDGRVRRQFQKSWLWVGAAALALVAMIASPFFHSPKASPQLALLEREFSGGRLDNDLGYSLNGISYTKGWTLEGPEPTAAESRLLDEYRQAISEFPEHLRLREKYGQLLLKLQRWAPARAQFHKALELDSQRGAANMGMGVIAFEHKQFDQARKYFELALKRELDNEDTQVNLAITLEKLHRHDAALSVWREIRNSTSDHKLQQKISEHLQRSPIESQ